MQQQEMHGGCWWEGHAAISPSLKTTSLISTYDVEIDSSGRKSK